MSSELKPCPFCGSEAELVVRYSVDYDQDVYYARCKKCDATIDFFSHSAAVEAWNRRAERTAKVTDTWKIGGYNELNAWCPECEHRITRGCSYCPTCGVKLDWSVENCQPENGDDFGDCQPKGER